MKQQLNTLLPVIRRFAYSLTGSVHDADDLVQSTFERLLAKPLPQDVDLTKWAFRVCRNLWIDEYRARKVRQVASESPQLRQGQSVDGQKASEDEIALERVNRAMGQLADEHRSVLSLVAVQGMAYKDVARTLEIPVGTVMSRLSRARVALVDLLSPPSQESVQ